jgi:hypothetical protein
MIDQNTMTSRAMPFQQGTADDAMAMKRMAGGAVAPRDIVTINNVTHMAYATSQDAEARARDLIELLNVLSIPTPALPRYMNDEPAKTNDSRISMPLTPMEAAVPAFDRVSDSLRFIAEGIAAILRHV